MTAVGSLYSPSNGRRGSRKGSLVAAAEGCARRNRSEISGAFAPGRDRTRTRKGANGRRKAARLSERGRL